MRLLIMRLEGPLQSWGERSKWDNRDSALMPTKSGVIGILACCMGILRDDARLTQLHRKLTVAVRADMPGVLGTDYQTVSSEKLLTADGKEQVKTIISPRQYLEDASFLVVLASEDGDLLDKIASSLRHPVWAAYLGRKCCVPTRPLIATDTDEYDSIETALDTVPLAERADPEVVNFRAEIEDPQGEYVRNDCLCTTERRFTTRRVRYYTVGRKNENAVPLTTEA